MEENITDVKAIGNVLSNNELCFGLQKENDALLVKMNEAIVSLKEAGTSKDISDNACVFVNCSKNATRKFCN